MQQSRTRLNQTLVVGVTSVALLGGLLLGEMTENAAFAAVVYVGAILIASLSSHRLITVTTALAVTAAIAIPWFLRLETETVPLDVFVVTGIAVCWMVTATLLWRPIGGQIHLDHLQDTFEQAPVGLALVSQHGIITAANTAFEEITARKFHSGREFAEFLGSDLWHEVTVLCAAPKPMSEPKEYRVTRFDGVQLYLSLFCRVLPKGTRKEPRYVVQVLDLTESFNTRQALEKSEARFQSIVENSEEVMIMLDADGEVRYANPVAQMVFGGSEFTDKLVRLAGDDGRDSLRRRLDTARATTGSFVVVDTVEDAHANPNWVELRFSPLDTPALDGTLVVGRVINERVLAEKEIRLSEARFSGVFHASPDAIVIINDGLIVDFNAAFTQLLGYEREDAIGAGEDELALLPNGDGRAEMIAILESHGECVGVETKLCDKHGRGIEVELSLRYVEIGGDMCTLAHIRDVRERKEAQSALRERQDQFEKIFTHSPDGIVIIRMADGVVVDINDAFADASGFEANEIIGHRVGELPIFANREELTKTTDLIRTKGRYQNFEITFITKDQELVPTLASATVFQLGEEPSILCVIKDIRALRSAEEQLRESEERFRGTFQHAPIGMLLVDTQGLVFQANDFACSVLDYELDDLVGTDISFLAPADERDGLRDMLNRLEHAEVPVATMERRLIRKTGLELWTKFHVVLLRSEEKHTRYFIVQIADISDIKLNRDRMERLAFYDSLTDLANRRLFTNRLEHAIQRALRAGHSAGFLYIDLDNFKRVNDTLGHEAGDDLLKQVGLRIRECVREEDTVARFGGDEFTVLLYDTEHPHDAGIVAEKIIDALQRPITVGHTEFMITPSIGITVLPQDGIDPNELTRNADRAMYRAKELGRNNYQFYSPAMHSDAVERHQIEIEIRRALTNDEFELYFQPKVRLTDQRVVGVEALLRWNHPRRGLLAPDMFIPVAEESGAIVDIGEWVIHKACESARAFAEHADSPIVIALNVSPRQFRDPRLISTIRKALEVTGVDSSLLELELTETALMNDAEAGATNLTTISDLGLSIAIDDFGTGLSSLNYLKRFPISTVKVDKSFIQDIPDNSDDQAITAAVIAMAHRLNMRVCAEGVETPEQLRFLQERGCEYAQGYYFSRAQPFEDICKFVAPNVKLLRS